MSKSTQQRWHADTRQANVYDEDGTIVTHLVETREDCRRIVSDHNGCIGINDPQTTVPELVEVCKSMIDRLDLGYFGATQLQRRARAVLTKTGKHDPPAH